MRVTLSGHSFLIDAEDWERLKGLPWRAHVSTLGRPIVTRQTGSRIAGEQRNICLYHDILNVTPGSLCVDHINGDPTDHRKQNLRLCTVAENSRNSRPRRHGLSPYKGVSPKRRRFLARIRVDGSDLRLGYFATAEEAARAYDAAARLHYGEFAWLNSNHFADLGQQEVQDHA
jgi:hypothetical protein